MPRAWARREAEMKYSDSAAAHDELINQPQPRKGPYRKVAAGHGGAGGAEPVSPGTMDARQGGVPVAESNDLIEEIIHAWHQQLKAERL